MNEKRATIADVARAARVHHSTVSLALRDHPSIPSSTRDRIKQAVEAVGYRPDPALAALSRFRHTPKAAPKAPRIVYATNLSPEMGFYDFGYTVHFLQGAREEAAALGFELDLQFLAPDFHDSDSLNDYLEESQATGLLLAAFLPGCLEITLDWEKYSVVKIDSQHIEPHVAIVTNDQLQMTRLAYRRLAALGYRRIGLSVGLADEPATNHRYASGYAIELASTPGNEPVPPLYAPYNMSRGAFRPLVAHWVRRHRIDAVISNTVSQADELRIEGLRVPEDVGFACLCLFERFEEMAGIVTNLRLVGARAVAQLAEQMRAGQKGVPPFPSETYIRGFWRDGPTAPPRDGTAPRPPEPLPEEPFSIILPSAGPRSSAVPPSNRPRPRMRDVAALAGVGTTTVSLALRNHPSIPVATQQKVRRAADEIGYRPDPMLDAFNLHRADILRPRHALTVAFVADSEPNLAAEGIENYHCDRLVWQGMQREAEVRGIRVERFVLEANLTPARLSQILVHRGIDGVVVSPFRTTVERLDLEWERFCAVKIESAHLEPAIDIVSSDQRAAIQAVFRRMRALGYRRIGLVTWDNDELRLERSYCAGLLVEQAKIPVQDRVRPLIFHTPDVPRLASLVPEWIQAEEVDAVITNWNNLLPLVRPTGAEPTGFASLDLRPDGSPMAGMVQNHRLVGRRALEQVSVLLRSNLRGIPRRQAITLVPGFWQDGPTATARWHAVDPG